MADPRAKMLPPETRESLIPTSLKGVENGMTTVTIKHQCDSAAEDAKISCQTSSQPTAGFNVTTPTMARSVGFGGS